MTRITCLLVSRLILNLKLAGDRTRVIGTNVTHLQYQSQLESYVFGNIANRMDGLDTPDSQTLQGDDGTELGSMSTDVESKLEGFCGVGSDKD